ncbi:Uncharacterized protein FWK35_00024361 [Aphis craccivora]|uniref:Uncharacterized protein n=1 Tax=Aphis craccivora TaxID=307492 RepID=A0A6G0YEL4_APHCR|nr:Uncharacterized protein FWK35_00024361 [Aphis craccivora]
MMLLHELESYSMRLRAFSTPFGSYQFRRLPFGLANAPEILQQLTSKYFGIGKQGIAPDFERVKSVVELKIPQSIKQLQSFLGMLNFLRIFIPNMFELIEPLKGLLRKDVL